MVFVANPTPPKAKYGQQRTQMPSNPVVVSYRQESAIAPPEKYKTLQANKLGKSIENKGVRFIVDTNNRIRIIFSPQGKIFARYSLAEDQVDLVSTRICSTCKIDYPQLYQCGTCMDVSYCTTCGKNHIEEKHLKLNKYY